MFSQMVIAVSLFHTQQLVHYDLKPGNIFIDEELNVILGLLNVFFVLLITSFMIGDFGEAHSFTGDYTGTVTALGSMLYMAPEIVKNEKYPILSLLLYLHIYFLFQTFVPM
jgi:serine/threonine protein kinase